MCPVFHKVFPNRCLIFVLFLAHIGMVLWYYASGGHKPIHSGSWNSTPQNAFLILVLLWALLSPGLNTTALQIVIAIELICAIASLHTFYVFYQFDYYLQNILLVTHFHVLLFVRVVTFLLLALVLKYHNGKTGGPVSLDRVNDDLPMVVMS